MTINSRILAIAGGLLMALTAAQPSTAQKRGGILKMYTPDSPASMSVLEESTVFSRCRLLARAFSEMQAAACPGGVERGPLRGTGDFPGPGLPFAPRDPTDVREGTSCGLVARAFSEMQAPAAPCGVERGPLRGTGDFPEKLGGFPRRGRSLWCE